MNKKIIGLLSVVACLSFSSVVAASPAEQVQQVQTQFIQDTKTSQVPAALLDSLQPGEELTITDTQEMKEFAAEEGSDQIPSKIVYEYYQNDENQSLDLNLPAPQLIVPSPKAAAKYTISTRDFGNGQYDPVRDLYQEYYVPGPDTFEIEETTKRSSKFDGSFGISVSAIEAKVGFEFGVEHELKWKSTTPVAKGQKIRFQLYTTYHKVQYTINTATACNFGYAYNPTGTLIKKVFY